MKTIDKELMRKVSGEKQYRAMQVDFGAIDEEARTVGLAFSSEDEYERWFGVEILDHSPGAVRLDRYMGEGAAFLVNHNTNDLVGVVEDVEISTDRRGRAVVRFGKSERAEEIFQDIINKIRRFISVGYMVHKMVLESQSDDGPDVYRVTDWEPFEISTVPVPADPTVGVGKSFEDHIPASPELKKGLDMGDENKTTEVPKVDVKAIKEDARKGGAEAEQTRISEILAISAKHGHADKADEFIKGNKSPDDFRRHVLENQGKLIPTTDSPEIGLTDKEVKNFSLIKMVNAMANPNDRGAQDAAAFEFEASTAAAKKQKKTPKGMIMPADVMLRGQTNIQKRDITAGPGGTGQYLIDTSMMTMIEALQNNMVLTAMGAQSFNGLQGDIAFPRESAQATTYWLGEDEDTTESDPGFGMLTMTPKTVGAFSDLTRKIIQQSSIDIENWLRGHLALKLAIRMDLAGIHGTGADGQPLGITNTTGIGSVVGGTNGANPDYADMVNLEREVAVDNALRGRMAFLTNPKVRAILRQTPENSSVPNSAWVWRTGMGLDGDVVGYPAVASNQVSSTLLKSGSSATGEHSAVIFGNFSDLYMGFWGGLDINVDTSAKSKSGGVRVVALQDADIGLAHVESFAAMLDATT